MSRRPVEIANLQQLADRYTEGEPLSVLACVEGLSRRTLKRRFAAMGLSIRGPREANGTTVSNVAELGRRYLRGESIRSLAVEPKVSGHTLERHLRLSGTAVPRPAPDGMVPFAKNKKVGHVPDENTGCWNWHGAINAQGYGYVDDGGRIRRAHILYYERERGPVPVGMEIDHLCRNPACVNPAHLEAVTHLTNVRRGLAVKANRERTWH